MYTYNVHTYSRGHSRQADKPSRIARASDIHTSLKIKGASREDIRVYMGESRHREI